MPTDKKVKNLVFNVLTEEQYESATKKEDEFYLTPDNSVEIEKVIPTDVAIKDNKLGLKHNSVWLTNQNAINLGEGLTYDEATKTLKAGGKSVPPTLNLIDLSGDVPGIRTTITEEEKTNLENGLYNQVIFPGSILSDFQLFMPSKLIGDNNFNTFAQFNCVTRGDTITINALSLYGYSFGEKDTSGNYPITIEKQDDIPIGSGVDVGIVELTDSQAQTLSDNNKITFTTEQAEILKTHQLIIVRYGSAIEYKGFVSRIYTQGQPDVYTIFMFLGYILYTIAITDFTAEQTLNSVTFPTSYTFSYDDSVNALIWSDGDYDRLVHLSTINGNPIAFNNASNAKNYSLTEDKTISLFGGHSILVPKDSADTSILPLPADASTSTYVLKAVNGTVQWVKES